MPDKNDAQGLTAIRRRVRGCRGDALTPSSAASIIAKVTRDRTMHELDVRWPGYGFTQHKGYPTRITSRRCGG